LDRNQRTSTFIAMVRETIQKPYQYS